MKRILSTLLFVGILVHSASAQEKRAAIADIAKVGPEGRGNEVAGRAWQELVKSDATAIPDVLAGMDDANDLAANYLRSAVDAIADRELGAGGKLPQADLEAFLADTNRNPRARRLAYELIERVSPETAKKLLPGFVNDPSLELRRDAVELLIEKADLALESKDKAIATIDFQEALGFARDGTQIKKIASQLSKLGQAVDLPHHFGFLTHWNVIGPFDNTGMVGFDTVFPPEKEINLGSEYDGKSGKVKWLEAATGDAYGMLDVNQVCGETKEVVAYAFTEFDSEKAQSVELRLGSKNGWKIWVNGKFIFGRDEYHRGARLDQYRLPIQLMAGKNTILVKVCQNDMVQDWTKEWEFQLRVSDHSGKAILAKNRLPTPTSTANATPRKSNP